MGRNSSVAPNLFHRDFATVDDHEVLGGGATATANLFDGADDVHALADDAKDDVAACAQGRATGAPALGTVRA